MDGLDRKDFSAGVGLADGGRMSRSFGVPGESARHQPDTHRKRREELERLERREHNWDGGAEGEVSTGDAIAARCPTAVALHDRRMPESRANIDHIVLVPSGVWVIDSKRMKGRIKVEDARDGTQRLLINGHNETRLVHKLTGQLNAVKAALDAIDPQLPVHGAFCFWLPIAKKRDLLNPFLEDNGLPLLHTWTINGYPLFHWRLMVRRLNARGALSAKHAERIGEALADRFPSALSRKTKLPSASEPAPVVAPKTPARPLPTPTAAAPAHRSTAEFKARKDAERLHAWEQQRPVLEAELGGPIPPLLADRLSSDGAIWCHPALWHARVYLACVHGKVGQSVPYTQAASVIGAHHDGRAGGPQWRALTAFLEHLRTHGYVDFTSVDGRIGDIAVTADLHRPPTR
jgi:hypothetical protein